MSRPVRPWPVWLLAAPAFVAIWSGWVGLGVMTGFGVVHPLPGIWDSFALNTAITLPIGVETYAAFALRVWLSTGVPEPARRFAKMSAIGSLALGAAGQIAYHVLAAAGVKSAPWWITTLVSCLPVAVLGMGAALAHLIRAGADVAQESAVVTEQADGEAEEEEIDEEEAAVGLAKLLADAVNAHWAEVLEPAAKLAGGELTDSGQSDLGDAPASGVQVETPRPRKQPPTAAERVRRALKKKPDGTQKEIAKIADVSVSTVRRYRGSKLTPSIEPVLPNGNKVNGAEPVLTTTATGSPA